MTVKIIEMEELRLNGVLGDGYKTAQLWNEFDERVQNKDLLVDTNYEVRFSYQDKCDCFVGFSGDNAKSDKFDTLTLP